MLLKILQGSFLELTTSLFILFVRTVCVAITQPALRDTAGVVVTTHRAVFSGLPAVQLVGPIRALLSPVAVVLLLKALASVQTLEDPLMERVESQHHSVKLKVQNQMNSPSFWSLKGKQTASFLNSIPQVIYNQTLLKCSGQLSQQASLGCLNMASYLFHYFKDLLEHYQVVHLGHSIAQPILRQILEHSSKFEEAKKQWKPTESVFKQSMTFIYDNLSSKYLCI